MNVAIGRDVFGFARLLIYVSYHSRISLTFHAKILCVVDR